MTHHIMFWAAAKNQNDKQHAWVLGDDGIIPVCEFSPSAEPSNIRSLDGPMRSSNVCSTCKRG